MPSGQVSIWVPVVVGVIGLIGVVVGQLINAWREDRRWKREQEREDLRWQRERERESDGREHDLRKYWIDKKLEYYANSLQVTRQWIEAAERASIHPRLGDELDEFASADGAFKEVFAQIEIFGSGYMHEIVEKLNDLQTSYFFSIVGAEQMPPDALKAMSSDLESSYKLMREQIRKELQIEEALDKSM